MKNNKAKNKFTLVSDNTTYQPYNVNTEDVLEVWKAQMIISKANTQHRWDVNQLANLVNNLQEQVSTLKKKDFSVLEDNKPQEIARFEKVTDLPIHAAVALDISASMEPNLAKAQQAALSGPDIGARKAFNPAPAVMALIALVEREDRQIFLIPSVADPRVVPVGR